MSLFAFLFAARRQVAYRVSANTQQLQIVLSALSGYSPGSSDVTISIDPGVFIWSDDTAVAALRIVGGALGDMCRIINQGSIMGKGGAGGDVSNAGLIPAGPGGPAIYVDSATLLISNYGFIGGGGGGGAACYTNSGGGPFCGGGGGAGGGSGGTASKSVPAVVSAAGGANAGVNAPGPDGGHDHTYTVYGGGGGGRMIPGDICGAPNLQHFAATSGGAPAVTTLPTEGGHGGHSGGSGSCGYLDGYGCATSGGGGGWGHAGGASFYTGDELPDGQITAFGGYGGSVGDAGGGVCASTTRAQIIMMSGGLGGRAVQLAGWAAMGEVIGAGNIFGLY